MLSFVPSYARIATAITTNSPVPKKRSFSAFERTIIGCTNFTSTTAIKRCRLPNAFVRSAHAESARTPSMSISELQGLKDIDGKPIDTSTFQNKVVFAMNVASACGYTQSGYDLLKTLTETFSPDVFVAVAIPCNSFGWQENGSPDDIKTFALARTDRLVITERSVVNGGDPHPIVALAKSKFPGRILWNFDGRFLFDKQGVPVGKFGNSSTTQEIVSAVEKLI